MPENCSSSFTTAIQRLSELTQHKTITVQNIFHNSGRSNNIYNIQLAITVIATITCHHVQDVAFDFSPGGC